jgi:hypothetical protein
MSLRLVRALAETENLDSLHVTRLLVLLGSADAKKRSSITKAQAVEGITKLAKLDFFLRYPTYLERALTVLGSSPRLAKVESRERTSIETKMIRFRYGPWDNRYRRWLGLLHARGLVSVGLQGKTVMIGLTDAGRNLSAEIRDAEPFRDLVERSELILKTLGTMSGTKLKNFVYDVVPELSAMRWGEEILP